MAIEGSSVVKPNIQVDGDTHSRHYASSGLLLTRTTARTMTTTGDGDDEETTMLMIRIIMLMKMKVKADLKL